MNKYILPLAFSTLLLFACTREQEPEINEASETVIAQELSFTELKIEDIPSENFEFLSEEGAELTLENGGRIRVLPNSLVNEKGEVIQGKVTLSFKEYHSLVDIIASGLPMRYDSAGVEYDFQSAGMFNIDATQNNLPVHIKEGEDVVVDLANYQDTKCYNFYALNEETENWEYLKTDSSQLQPKEEELFLDVNDELRYEHLESLKGEVVIAWKVLDDRENADLEKLSPQFVKEIEGEYVMSCIGGGRMYELTVDPVLLTEMEVEEGMNTNMLYAYRSKTKSFRRASINSFGYYNWDKIMKVPEYFATVSTLAFPSLMPSDYRVKLLVYERNGVFERTPSIRTQLPLYLDSKMLLMAISKYGDVSIIGAKDIAAFAKGELEYLPPFTPLKGKFKTNEELEAIMQDYI